MPNLIGAFMVKLGTEWFVELLNWWRHNKRDFPWRRTNNWYYILVAEFMLIRTRSETVERAYDDFIQHFPTPETLCNASASDIIEHFEKLGLPERGLRLHKAVCTILEKYGGSIPCDRRELLKLPGVGEYVAAVILTKVCSEPEPFVDSNVLRVLSRLLGTFLKAPAARDLLKTLIPAEHLEEVNIGLLDLAAVVCKPRKPRCIECPLRGYCSYARSLTQS